MSLFTPSTEQAALVVGGREFAGWTQLTITASLEDAARAFTVEAAAKKATDVHLLDLRPGSAVEVYAGRDLVITGYIDKIDVSHDSKSHKVRVSGRSKTGDLVDCSAIHKPKQWRSKTADTIAADLASDYDVDVYADPSIDWSKKIARFALQDGETVIAALQRLGQLRSFMVTDDPAGRCVLTGPKTDASSDVDLVVGENVISGSASVDVSGRFTEYRCKSVRLGDDNDYGETLQSDESVVDSEDLGRSRVLVIRPESGEGAARCRDRATWEAATRYGQSISLTYTVQGWRQTPGGRLWSPNELIGVEDNLAGVDGDFLIIDVDFSLSDSGTLTKLSLAPPEGYELLPPMQKRRRGGKRRKRASSPFDALKDGVNISGGRK